MYAEVRSALANQRIMINSHTDAESKLMTSTDYIVGGVCILLAASPYVAL